MMMKAMFLLTHQSCWIWIRCPQSGNACLILECSSPSILDLMGWFVWIRTSILNAGSYECFFFAVVTSYPVQDGDFQIKSLGIWCSDSNLWPPAMGWCAAVEACCPRSRTVMPRASWEYFVYFTDGRVCAFCFVFASHWVTCTDWQLLLCASWPCATYLFNRNKASPTNY